MEARRSPLDAALTLVNNLLAVIAAIMIIFMMLAICYSSLMRFLWNASVPWVVEVSSYLMLYITFLCIAWLQGRDGHVRIDLVTSNLRPRARAILDALASFCGVVIGFILTWKGTTVTVDCWLRDVTVIGILNTPQFCLMAIIPIGGALLLLESLLRMGRSYRIAQQNIRDGGQSVPEAQV